MAGKGMKTAKTQAGVKKPAAESAIPESFAMAQAQEDSDVDSEEFVDSDEGSEEDEDSEDNDNDEEDSDGEEESGSENSDDEIDSAEESEGEQFEENDSVDDEVEEFAASEEALKSLHDAESHRRQWLSDRKITEKTKGELASLLHTDDLSSDDEEAEGNTVGRIPLHWYDAYDHVGYDVSGKKVMKRVGKDRLDLAISNSDDPVARRTVYDMYNDREVVLSERDLELLRRIQAGAFAHPEHNDTPDYVDYESSKREIMPLSGRPEPKHRFLPSKFEIQKVQKIVKAIREGTYKSIEERQQEKRDSQRPPVYLIWDDEKDDILNESKRNKFHLPAPKMVLPGHAESYNPPAEYILSEEEIAQMNDQDPTDRQYNFIPKQHDCLRHVAGYQNFVKERFDRCLDLYLCPRKLKLRLNIDPETLVPRLPKPRELRPYPNSLCLQYLGHRKAVRSISVSPDGQFLASGSDDGSVKLWEVDTCLCRHTWEFGQPVSIVAWNPNPNHHLLAVAVGSSVVLISTGTGDADGTELTETLLSAAKETAANAASDEDNAESSEDEDENEDGSGKRKLVASWKLHKLFDSDSEAESKPTRFGVFVGPTIQLNLKDPVTHLMWHHKGDYIATLTPESGAHAVAIHQLSKGKSQSPFSKSPGRVQAVTFHPSRPYLFVVTQQHVKVFHLVEQKLVKKLLSGCKWLSSIDIHPSGDHLILGSYDRRVVWFDLDLGSTPYKTLKFHEKAVRGVQYHKRYPLMASGSDDGKVHVFHATVYSDLTRNPMIVPLKILRGHGVVGGMGVLSVQFHPRQPWLFTSGADSVINLFQDI